MKSISIEKEKHPSTLIEGMTDAELESACEQKSLGFTPWIYWTTEMYSIGKCLREWTRYPSFLPLFVYSDHGAGLGSHLPPHALKNRANIYLTWNPIKELRHKNLKSKKVIQIINPWISYRHLHGLARCDKPKGTLVFIPHCTPHVKCERYDIDDYIEGLNKLPEKFHPIVLCLHMHDIKQGLHKKLRHYGLPIVTVGNAKSSYFVDRFYELVKNFSYATSQSWGSQVAYCVELGIPYFFMGEGPVFVNVSDNNFPLGKLNRYVDEFQEELDKKVKKLFSHPVDKVTDEQREIIETVLGFNSPLTREQVARLLWRELFKNWWKWPLILKPLFATVAHNLKSIRMIK